MATTIVLPIRLSVHTQRILHNNPTKPVLHRKTTRYFEYYIPTVTLNETSIQHLISQYYLLKQREKHFYETTGILHDDSYQTQWF
jgi:hypothetical protein